MQGAAAGAAALPLMGTAAQAASPDGSAAERNKRAVEAQHQRQERGALPNTIPGDPEPAQGAVADASTMVSAQDPPGGVDDPKLTIGAIAPWHAQSVAPPFHSFGPLIAEGEYVIEEWETFFYGLDGTMYSNHYVLARQFRDDKIIETHEYLDSHHAFIVLGLHAPWKDLPPNRAPRRRWRPGKSSAGLAPLTEMETVFPVRQAFDLDPRLLRDVIPAGGPPKRLDSTPEGDKAVLRAMRDAQARGDAAAVAACHGAGFRHFIAGEGPLGWNHLPVQDLYAPLVKHLASPIKVRFGPMVAEHGAVYEEMDVMARLDDGSVYNNWHCFIHEVRNGQIVQTREYMDTHHFWVMLGRWAEWGKTPVPPLRQARRSNLPYVRATYQVRNPFLKLDRWTPLPGA